MGELYVIVCVSVSSNMLTLHQSHRSCIISSHAVLVQFPNFLQFSPRSSNTLHVTPIIPESPQPNHYPVSPSGPARRHQHCEKLTSLSSAARTQPEDDEQEQSSNINQLSHVSIVLTPIKDASFQNHNGKSFRSEEPLAGLGWNLSLINVNKSQVAAATSSSCPHVLRQICNNRMVERFQFFFYCREQRAVEHRAVFRQHFFMDQNLSNKENSLF